MEKLTIDKLKEMKAGTIFATGTGTYPELTEQEVRWVACRGGMHDWCIYYAETDKSNLWIQKQGDKCFTESVIKRLVPCDDEAFEMYRY